MHPAAWVIDELHTQGWKVTDVLAFTRASTLTLVEHDGSNAVLKSGFGSDHVLAALTDADRPAAYGFYWYQELTQAERALKREDFRHEIGLSRAATGAPNTVPVLDSGSYEHFDWYLMPHYPAGNFRDHIFARYRNATPNAPGYQILADVAEALAGLHDRGIIHRDVYQENILISGSRGVLTDLGAARRASTPRGSQRRPPEIHWPPEYMTDYAAAGPPADVFSLGVLMYRYCTGDIPRIHSTQATERLPKQLRGSILGALEHDSAARPSMRELHRALQQCAPAEMKPNDIQ